MYISIFSIIKSIKFFNGLAGLFFFVPLFLYLFLMYYNSNDTVFNDQVKIT